MAPHVIIIGAGLGGLALAQALHGDVAVYERDPHPFARGQGYRIHLDPEADQVLRECLPPSVYRLFRDTSGLSLGVPLLMTEQLVMLNDVDYQIRYGYDEPVADAVVDRLTFRQALAAGLDGVIHYGKVFTGCVVLDSGRVRAHFADGTTADADLLVGADGANSAVRGHLLPDAPFFDSGLRLIYGKTPLTDARRRALPDALVGGFGIVTAPGNRGMALGWHEYREAPAAVAARLGIDVDFGETGDYLMWALVLPADAPRDDSLHATAVAHTVDWHPALREVVAGASPQSLTFLPLRTSLPVDPLPPGPVTLIGDAAHAMFPAGGGTTVALRDVHHLLEALRTSTSVAEAVDEYQRAMSAYAWKDVRDSYDMAERLGGHPWPLG